MKDILRKSLRTALIFAAIGATVAIATPLIMSGLAAMGLLNAGALGSVATATVVHTSLIFGGFGALSPIYEAATDLLFGKAKPDALEAAPPTHTPKLMVLVARPRAKAPEEAQQLQSPEEEAGRKYRDYLEAAYKLQTGKNMGLN